MKQKVESKHELHAIILEATTLRSEGHSHLKYRKIYKYQTYEDQMFETYVKPEFTNFIPVNADIDDPDKPDPWVVLYPNGDIWIKKGYSWNGASGPTIDTEDSMTGSLVHDALYQLTKEGFLHMRFRKLADLTFRDWCRHDGMGKFRSSIWYLAVRIFGRSHAKKRKLRNPNAA